jgi:single-stranded DNA-specific DHH superfamily exonuclease
MINEEKLSELKELLEHSQNPLIFYDNDSDGFCSYLIIRRVLGRGKGVQIKSYPELTSQYLHKVNELNPDSIIVLDKADISEEFINGIEERNIPIIWVDHHNSNTNKKLIEKTNYFNSFPESEPTTYIIQKTFNRDEDLWLAMIGCISDVYTPSFGNKFEKKYPELYNSNLSAFNALHSTEIGKFSLMINFGLMNSVSNVIKMSKYLEKANSPYDILEENFYTKEFHARYKELKAELDKLCKKALETKQKNRKILYFSYAGQTSMSALLANQLYFEYPEKLIIVAYKKPDKINLSIRGIQALEFTEKLVKEISNSVGGGHPEATGAMIPSLELDNFEKFIEEF